MTAKQANKNLLRKKDLLRKVLFWRDDILAARAEKGGALTKRETRELDELDRAIAVLRSRLEKHQHG